MAAHDRPADQKMSVQPGMVSLVGSEAQGGCELAEVEHPCPGDRALLEKQGLPGIGGEFMQGQVAFICSLEMGDLGTVHQSPLEVL